MAGRRSTNLRKGDLAEGLGIEMLRAFTAVAPVPRSEDIGVDVICTLLRPDGAMQYAEDSFYVQIKSASIFEITYQDDSYSWLCELFLPIFIARVNLVAAQIEIFSMQRVFTRVKHSSKGVKVYLGECNEDLSQNICLISLGQPILQWGFSEIAEESFHDHKYKIMKAWVRHEQRNRLLRQAYRCQELEWSINKLPSEGSTKIGANDKNIKKLLEGIAPFLFPLADSLIGQVYSGNGEALKSLKTVLELDRLVRIYEVETDPLPVIGLLVIKNLMKDMSIDEKKEALPQILKDLGMSTNES
jgi:hypothetical protein